MSLRLLSSAMAIGFLALTATAASADDWQPVWTERVPRDKLKAAFPKEARETGGAALDCVAAKDGRLVDCKIAEEQPAGQGFGAAALGVVGYERIKPKDDAGASVAGRPVRTYFTFLAPGDANPDWLRRPTGDDLFAVFPAKALSRGQRGRAAIRCKISIEGILEDCVVVEETPAGFGFGAAALQLSTQLRMTPKIRGGKPVPGGEVTVPMVWPEIQPQRSVGIASVLSDPPWAKVPTQAEVNATWPKEAAGLTGGQAALRCGLTASGALYECSVLSETPENKGFGRAARELTKSFRVLLDTDTDANMRRYQVDVPIRFHDPAAPDARKLTKPRWTQTLNEEGQALIYPAAATLAGVQSGRGVVSCVVSAEGRLVQCQVARETPAGMGFGEAAIKAALFMRMSPWTKEGETLEGLKVTLPFDFTLPEETAAPPASPAKP